MESRMLESIGLDPGYLFLAMFIMIVLLFFFTVSVNMKYNRLKNSYNRFMKGKDGKTLEEEMNQKFLELDQIAEKTGAIGNELKEISQHLKGHYQKVGIVRYNAFEGMEHKLSFALTLLDGDDNGFILNVMHTQERCYTYMKEVIKGQSYIELCEEEEESLDRAIFQEAYGLDFKE